MKNEEEIKKKFLSFLDPGDPPGFKEGDVFTIWFPSELKEEMKSSFPMLDWESVPEDQCYIEWRYGGE